jgi:hypothetical protein
VHVAVLVKLVCKGSMWRSKSVGSLHKKLHAKERACLLLLFSSGCQIPRVAACTSLTVVVQKALCVDSPMFLDGYVGIQGSLGEEFYYTDLADSGKVDNPSYRFNSAMCKNTLYCIFMPMIKTFLLWTFTSRRIMRTG